MNNRRDWEHSIMGGEIGIMCGCGKVQATLYHNKLYTLPHEAALYHMKLMCGHAPTCNLDPSSFPPHPDILGYNRKCESTSYKPLARGQWYV